MTRFHWLLDGSIVGLYLLVTMAVGITMRRYVGKLEDYLVAGREVDLHLGIASLAATEFGIITCMYTAQAGYTQGFSGAMPGICQAVAMALIGLTGFCIKPLRQAGAMTLPEMFEQRFGKTVRWLSGIVIVMGGLLNMGVFLQIGGKFLCTVAGFDLSNLTLIMTALLLMVVIYTVLGGMLSVLVTDFIQFIVMSAGLLVVSLLVLKHVGWETLVETVRKHHGGGGFNPLANPALGWPFLINQFIANAAAALTWQAVIVRILSAKDSQTSQRIYTRTSFFFVCRFLLPGIWGIAALATFGWAPLKQLTETERAAIPVAIQEKISASAVGAPLAGLSPAETATLPAETQARLGDTSLLAMPQFLSVFLPAGLMGLLIAAMLAADMSTNSSYMLSWGSVIYNDILAPFRRSAWPDKRAIRWNRCIVALIGLYLLVFGLFYHIEGNVWSYLLLTGSIYLSSMSVLLIACCYWRRANNWGAIGGIVLGATVPIVHLTLEKLPSTAGFAASIGKDIAGVAAFIAAALGMIAGSLLKPHPKTP
ncbi:MAG: sodium:solute symporter family protein [Prosthecobacter sp.]|uniref:sodium:solute symporter family protein n=1 Tax=Prosthecobacter sp. TaxID=1965333 RepID=UPI001A027A3B|nr:sodium:solute symporter family protein [Prosthecobacter sp.]MBE2282915.1 sodium:solute symporter family protein [Prosthecobacter sp.]